MTSKQGAAAVTGPASATALNDEAQDGMTTAVVWGFGPYGAHDTDKLNWYSHHWGDLAEMLANAKTIVETRAQRAGGNAVPFRPLGLIMDELEGTGRMQDAMAFLAANGPRLGVYVQSWAEWEGRSPSNDPKLPSRTDVLRAGLAWMYDTVQPEGARVGHLGQILRATGNRQYRFGPDGKVSVEVSRREFGNGLGTCPTNGLPAGEPEALQAEIEAMGYKVAKVFNGGVGATTVTMLLERPVHPSLTAAAQLGQSGCPEHPDKRRWCDCGAVEEQYAKAVRLKL